MAKKVKKFSGASRRRDTPDHALRLPRGRNVSAKIYSFGILERAIDFCAAVLLKCWCLRGSSSSAMIAAGGVPAVERGVWVRGGNPRMSVTGGAIPSCNWRRSFGRCANIFIASRASAPCGNSQSAGRSHASCTHGLADRRRSRPAARPQDTSCECTSASSM